MTSSSFILEIDICRKFAVGFFGWVQYFDRSASSGFSRTAEIPASDLLFVISNDISDTSQDDEEGEKGEDVSEAEQMMKWSEDD